LAKPKRKLTAAEKAEKRRRRREYMTILRIRPLTAVSNGPRVGRRTTRPTVRTRGPLGTAVKRPLQACVGVPGANRRGIDRRAARSVWPSWQAAGQAPLPQKLKRRERMDRATLSEAASRGRRHPWPLATPASTRLRGGQRQAVFAVCRGREDHEKSESTKQTEERPPVSRSFFAFSLFRPFAISSGKEAGE
jgi:hypothetical protein